MNDPKLVLSKAEYTNYRNVRASALMFIVLGLLFGSVAILFLSGGGRNNTAGNLSGDVPGPALTSLFLILGLSGVVGGIAVRRAHRKWSKVIYILAALYILVFPIGTVLSFVILTGTNKYLDSIDVIRGTKSFGFPPTMPNPPQ